MSLIDLVDDTKQAQSRDNKYLRFQRPFFQVQHFGRVFVLFKKPGASQEKRSLQLKPYNDFCFKTLGNIINKD